MLCLLQVPLSLPVESGVGPLWVPPGRGPGDLADPLIMTPQGSFLCQMETNRRLRSGHRTDGSSSTMYRFLLSLLFTFVLQIQSSGKVRSHEIIPETTVFIPSGDFHVCAYPVAP